MKLRCFNCLRLFKKRSEIFRNRYNYPLCEDCFREEISDHDWLDDYVDNVLDEVRNKYNGKYNNFLKDFHKKYELCNGCDESFEAIYYLKDYLIEVDGKMYCESCHEEYMKKGLEVEIN